MEKKEFVNSFIDTLNSNDEERIYKFFTSRTLVYDVKNNKDLTLDELVNIIKTKLLNKNLVIKRTFESAVCIKIELDVEGFDYEALLFEIKDRRFFRVELM